MYTLNSVLFSVSITISSIYPFLFKETSSLSNYELPCTKEKDGKIRTFSLWTRDYFTCLDSLVLSIPTDNVYLLFNKLLNR